MEDYSFIRLEPTLSLARYTRNSPVATIVNNWFIRFETDKTYFQISNTKTGIAFDGNYTVFVVDCSGNELLDITNKVAIFEFIDNRGLPQIAFEITNIGTDYYMQEVSLRFRHSSVLSNVFYSNPILITNYQKQFNTFFEYRSYKDFFGTAYNKVNKYQAISLHCYFDVNNAEESSKEYTSTDGIRVTSNVISTDLEKYIFEKGIDNFTYRRLNKLLTNSVIYVNGNRMTNKLVNQSDERIGDTNRFNQEFEIAVNYNETKDYEYQLFSLLELTAKEPLGAISIIPTEIVGTFNQTITKNTGNIYLYKDAVLFATFTQNDIDVVGSVFTIDISGLTIDEAEYYILIDSGLFSGITGNYNGISNSTDWSFELVEGEYEDSDYDENDYLT
jgi:hypothetical protein